MHSKNIKFAGQHLKTAEKVLIMLHGRGAEAEDILSLSGHLNISDYALIAPRAENNTWYPYSFMASRQQNEPWLSSAISLISEIVDDLISDGMPRERIYFCGFSQGACLALEYAARHPMQYGGIAAFTGGLIGDIIKTEDYHGDFLGTPVFIGTSDPDPHVPLDRVNLTAEIFKSLNADVTLKVYKNLGHTISNDEIDSANKVIFTK